MDKSDIGKIFAVTNSELIDYLDDHKDTIKCSVCENTYGKGIFPLSINRDSKKPHVLSMPVASQGENQTIEFLTPGLQHFYYQITCSKCGHAIFFSAMDVIRHMERN
ncbi:hypothetical protein AAEJ42_02170 [Shewanella algae]|uniref:hypothetical protein n=1 Tax=Shewanella algae TaxID=38313 RepID=UPI00313E084E